ncbi:hypothetical protein CEP52_012941 [Fusarium oligoseptatum]|uniref:Uncharacterized protein n=1 Tax=Fusarium oligoseptatum TaxID=2604345 RepID=A0A428SW95_9HYPO|nr:hypothetical protein CEP52_012941 [Fusarium oligoseptatum]
MAEPQLELQSLGRCILGTFKALSDAMWDITEDNGFPSKDRISTEHQRFILWAQSLGLSQVGHASLDYRVRDASVVKASLADLLTELGDHLENLASILLGSRQPLEQDPGSSNQDQEASSEAALSDDQSSLSSLSSFGSFREVDFRLESVSKRLDALYELASRIRSPRNRPQRPAEELYKHIPEKQRADYIKSQKEIEISRVFYVQKQQLLQGFAAGQLEELGISQDQLLQEYSSPDYWLIRRTGVANARRKQQFVYWRRHAKLLSRDMTENEIQGPAAPAVCTYEDCTDPDRLYRLRQDWIDHENQHRRVWHCHIHQEEFETQPEYIQHLQDRQDEHSKDDRLPEMVAAVVGSSSKPLRDCLRSETQRCQAVQIFFDDEQKQSITVVDTPGFDDTYRSQGEILAEISEFLAAQMTGSSMTSLRLLRSLVGDEALGNVIFVTNMWNKLRDEDRGEALRREQELIDEFWSPMIEKGSYVAQFDGTTESAFSLVYHLAGKESVVLNVQKQIMDQDKSVLGTSAGEDLAYKLEQDIKQYRVQVEDLEAQLRDELRAQPQNRELIQILQEDKTEVNRLLEEMEASMERMNVRLRSSTKQHIKQAQKQRGNNTIADRLRQWQWKFQKLLSRNEASDP